MSDRPGPRRHGAVTPESVAAWVRARFGIGPARDPDGLHDRLPLDPDREPERARDVVDDA